jgi:hypothetical protein
MQLPKAPSAYDYSDQAQLRGILEREDRRNLKAGMVFDKILVRDSVSGTIRTLSVTGGTLVIT